jgi:hypothetical protein
MAKVLVCVECSTSSDAAARGWKAYIGGGYEGEAITVGTFCPACAEREFKTPLAQVNKPG